MGFHISSPAMSQLDAEFVIGLDGTVVDGTARVLEGGREGERLPACSHVNKKYAVSEHYNILLLQSPSILNFTTQFSGQVQLGIIDDNVINEDRELLLTLAVTSALNNSVMFRITRPTARVTIVNNEGR